MENKVKKNAFILLVLALLSKGLAFFREIVMAYFFGAGILLDAFNAGISLSNSLLFLFSGGAFIPLLITFFGATEKKDAKKLNGFLLFLLSLSVMISIAVVITAPWLVSDVSEHLRGNVITVIRITAFSTVFYALSSIIRAWLNNLGEYGYSGAQDFAMMIVLLIGIFLSSKGNSLNLLSLSYLLASVFRVLVQIPALLKHRNELVRGLEWNWKAIVNNSIHFFPMVIATLVPQVMIVFTRILSSHLDVGTISGLSYADRTSDLIKSVIAYSLGAVIVAPLAKHMKENDTGKFFGLLNKSLLYSFYVSIPLFFIFLFWGREIISIMYERGSFSSTATAVTGAALSYYSVATLFSSPIFIIMSAMYSVNNWKGVLRSTLVSVIMGIGFMYLTYRNLEVIGIALGVGVYSGLIFVLLYHQLLKLYKVGLDKKFVNKMIRLFAVNLLIFSVMYFAYRIEPLITLITPAVFLAVHWILKDDITLDMLRMAAKFYRKRILKNHVS